MIKKALYIFVICALVLVIIGVIPKGSVFVSTTERLERVSNLGNGSFEYSNSSIPIFLADNLKTKPVPTNRIWSSVVFFGELYGLYTYPLAAETTNGVLAVGSPDRVAVTNVVTAQLGGNFFTIGSDSLVDKVYLSEYSDLTVTLDFRDTNNTTLFYGTFTQGSPYIFIQPKVSKLTISTNVYKTSERDGTVVLSYKDKNFGVFGSGKTTIDKDKVNITFDAPDGYVALGLFKGDDTFATVKALSANVIKSINVEPVIANEEFGTKYSVQYTDKSVSQKTLFGYLPHQYQNDIPKTALYTLDTLRGAQYMQEVGSEFKINIPRTAIVENLPYINKDEARKALLVKYLLEDVEKLNSSSANATTSYFGAKNLAKIARLLQIAESLGQPEVQTKLVAMLKAECEDWFTYKDSDVGKHFVYDTYFGGLIAQQAEFDSAKYNDHHFHYGYFIYAAAVLAKYDSEFKEKYKPVVSNIISDIANSDKNNKSYPFMRVFDFYEGHSWASGIQPFDDGNNQESTSEAINAWYAVWLWGKTTDDKSLMDTGLYLYNAEINSANYYWLNRSSNKTIFFDPAYEHDTASLVWGGKYEYNTFFSQNPLAIQGIQYLPITPGSIYLYDKKYIARDKDRNKKVFESQRGEWLDLNMMYFGMTDGLNVTHGDILNAIPIDDGNTRSNVYSWLLFWENAKNVELFSGSGYSGLTYTSDKDKTSRILVDCTTETDVIITTSKISKLPLKCTKGLVHKIVTGDRGKYTLKDIV